MKKTFLFDLDGTVLPMDFNKFMELYFYNIGKYFKDLVDPTLMPKLIMASTEKMIKINDGRTNEEIFMTDFETLVEGDINTYRKMFEAFYNSEFKHVKASTYQSKEMRQSIDILKSKGYEVVLATNPLFPLVANHHRINWAGFEPTEFSYISSFEENRHCKPFPEFYLEVLKNINRKPEECYMVGNDVLEDLVAGKLGIETYLITDCMLNRSNIEYKADHEGTYKDFLEFVKGLEPIK